MATSDRPDIPIPSSPGLESLPRINVFTMFRLGLVQMGLGIMAILMLGVLNRIMIQELAIPATIVGGSLAMYQIVAPSRILFGHLSDSRPILGYNRTGYVWLGGILFTSLAFVVVQVVWQLNRSAETFGWSGPTYAWVAVLAGTFALYGLCISATSTPFFALMVDVSDEDNRGKLVGIAWSMLTVGIGLGAGVGSGLVRGIDSVESLQPVINRLFTIVPAVVFLLVILATLGIEKKFSRFRLRSQVNASQVNTSQGNPAEPPLNLKRIVRILTASRQTGFFFSYLVLLILGMFMQQPILEPFAGEVFGMTVAESTFLNTFWSLGSLVSLGITGFLIVPRLGKKATAKLGCILLAGCFILIFFAGVTQMPTLLQASLVLFGLAIGVATGSSISLMLDLTTAETAGTFTGLWGLAQALSQALSTLLGGALLDVGRQLFQDPIWAYGTVFWLESLVILSAIILLRRVDVEEFRANAKQAVLATAEQDMN